MTVDFDLVITYRNNGVTTTVRHGATTEMINAVKGVWDLLADGIPPNWEEREEYHKAAWDYLESPPVYNDDNPHPDSPRVQMWGDMSFDFGKGRIIRYSLNNINEYTMPSTVIHHIKMIYMSDIVIPVDSVPQPNMGQPAPPPQPAGPFTPPLPKPQSAIQSPNQVTHLGSYDYKATAIFNQHVGQLVSFDIAAFEPQSKLMKGDPVKTLGVYSFHNGMPSRHRAYALETPVDWINRDTLPEFKEFASTLTEKVTGYWIGTYKVGTYQKSDGTTAYNFKLVNMTEAATGEDAHPF